MTISALAGSSRSVVCPAHHGIGSPLMPPANSYSETFLGKPLRADQTMNSGSTPQAAATSIDFAALPGSGDVQARVLARRQVQPDSRGPGSSCGRCRRSGSQRPGSRVITESACPRIAAAVQRPVLRERQLVRSISSPVSLCS